MSSAMDCWGARAGCRRVGSPFGGPVSKYTDDSLGAWHGPARFVCRAWAAALGMPQTTTPTVQRNGKWCSRKVGQEVRPQSRGWTAAAAACRATPTTAPCHAVRRSDRPPIGCCGGLATARRRPSWALGPGLLAAKRGLGGVQTSSLSLPCRVLSAAGMLPVQSGCLRAARRVSPLTSPAAVR